jgi:hypothetical protein
MARFIDTLSPTPRSAAGIFRPAKNTRLSIQNNFSYKKQIFVKFYISDLY